MNNGAIRQNEHSSDTSGTKKPAVIVCHAFGGLSEFEEGRAKELAKVTPVFVVLCCTKALAFQLGFVGFALDVYGKGKRGTTFEENRALMAPFREDRPGLLRRRLLAALDHVKSYDFVDPKKVSEAGLINKIRRRGEPGPVFAWLVGSRHPE